MTKPLMIVALVGLPGSGKTTYAKMLVKDDHSFIRISRDDIRRMLTGMQNKDASWNACHDRGWADLTRHFRSALVMEALKQGKNVVVDECHLFLPARQEIEEVAHQARLILDQPVLLRFHNMNKDVETCIKHDRQRVDNERVGESAIRSMHRKAKF